MQQSIAGYDVTRRLVRFYASSLYLASHHENKTSALIKTLNASYPKKTDVKRLEREYHVLAGLKGAEGIIEVSALEYDENGIPAIVSSTSGLPLAHYLADGSYRSWPLTRVIDIAIQLIKALGLVHEHNVVHKNVAPQNILLDARSWNVHLMNFEIATVLSSERQRGGVSRRLEGSLPYISPEQTGRMNRDLDYRSDFYSLGVVLYQLLFGRRPFEAESTLEWVHAHISKRPAAPDRTDTALAKVLFEIVMRLMAKSPDDRYQSSFGLLHDLEECRRQLDEQGRVHDFILGTRDISEAFNIPHVLYGRETELRILSELFEKVERGSSEICLISGYSGVGKSALVNELSNPIVRSRGYFLRGKFDQYERATPYSAISSAFSDLVHELLIEPNERLEFWREHITGVLAPNAQAMIDIIPDLEKIIGPQPPVPVLPPTEANNRLQIVLQNFVRLLARPERPLVLFLDDLQWSDAPTLNLLQRLATARDITNLLILGAYRTNEVDAGHTLRLIRDEIAKTCNLHELKLLPLDADAVGEIVAGTLRSDQATSAPLSELIFRKTEGNPLFVNELLKSMAEEELIRFDRAIGRWTWDMTEVQQATISDSVVEFLISTLLKLPEQTRHALHLAACIGNEFDLGTLVIVHQCPSREVGAAIMHALKRNVVLPLDDSYQYFDQPATGHGDPLGPGVNPRFRFQHDRLQQAAYELVDDADKRRIHLSIGRLIQKETERDGNDDHLIAIVRHLNEGRALLTEEAERENLARLNLAAARRAHAVSAYQAALQYLNTGRELLREDPWRNQYSLTKDLSAQFAQTAYLNGLHDDAEAELDTALAQMRTPLERAEILSMRTRHYSTLGRMEDAIRAALEGLRLLGIDISVDLSDEAVAAELEAIEVNRDGREIADLIHANRMADPEVSVAVGLLMEIFPPAFLSGAGNLFHYLVAKSVNLSLQYGNSTESAFAFATYGMLLCGKLNDPKQGYEYGRLALAMNESFDDIGLKSRIIYVYGMFIHHWSHHWSSMTDWFRKGIETGLQSGDLLYLAYSAQDCIIWDPALDLETASAEQRKYLEIVRDCEYQDSLDSGSLFLQMQLNFLDRTRGRYTLNDDSFDEAACYKGMRARKFLTGVANYHIYKTEIHFLYGDYEGALRHIRVQDELMDSVMSLPQSARYRFVAFLTLAALLPDMKSVEKTAVRERLEADLMQMKLWAGNCPDNFRHLELAMVAELARLDGESTKALQTYEQALEAAHLSGFLHDEATISELAAKAFATFGLKRASETHLLAAHHLYYRWGAQRKVAQLEEAYPVLRHRVDQDANHVQDSEQLYGDVAEGIALDSLDIASVMKAARAISGEIVLTNLWSRTMQILLECAGAQRGVFVTRGNNRLRAEAQGIVEDGKITLYQAERAGDEEAVVPHSIVTYALRSRSPVILDNAATSARFGNDPYVARRGTKSVICVPIVRSEQFEGAIYLENDLAAGAFSRDRADVVELLAAQASISIENAQLYVDLERKVEERTSELSRKTTALEMVANQLSKYLSPQIYQSIFDRKQDVRLTSERKQLTVFFSDLVGFTETADRLESEDLTQLLNHYLTEMSDIALAHGATIDKFVGDAIVIFFGDPETRGTKEDALACVRMAIAMRERLQELRKHWKKQGIEHPFKCRMGIHTGFCTVGNFGSETRMDYTIIGGAVNLASRLESAAAPGQILISFETHAQIKDEIFCKELGDLAVRGISHAVAIFEVVDLIENVTSDARPIREDLPHLQLSADPSNMSDSERREAAERLRYAASRLEGAREKNRAEAPARLKKLPSAD